MISLKRKNKTINNICENNILLKKTKLDIIIWEEMISASSIRNYMLDDPLIDWLKYYNITNLTSIPTKSITTTTTTTNNNTFAEYIMEQGIIYEKMVFNYIKEQFSKNYKIIQVAESYESRSVEKYNNTLQYMKEGFDIIYQGVLHDIDNNIYGCPDLIIRSDKFFDIFNYNILNPNVGAPLLSTMYHYVIVDIKHSTLHLASDGIHLINSNNMPAYKGQILIYNRLISHAMGYMPEAGYIMGKKSNMSNTSNNSIYTFGTVNYKVYDNSYNNKVDNAILWLKDMRKNGHMWHLLPKPCRNELYPNMKNDDEKYNKIKNELSNKIHEITSIWQCSYNKRQIAHTKKIYSWKDKKCTSINLGFNEGKISNTLNHILDINRSNKIHIRVCDLIKTNGWRKFENNIMEFYIDFETKYNDSISEEGNNLIFMICVGWEVNNTWAHQTFTLEYNTNSSELNMINNMLEFTNTMMIEMNKTESIFIHWTPAEPTFYNNFLNKHRFINNRFINSKKYDITFYDLNKLFLNNNIVIKNATNFKLKTVANAMYKNKMIKTCWDSNNICSNGLQAMYLAIILYRDNNRIDMNNTTIQNISNYNMIDTKVMWEILKYLRTTF